MKEYKIDIPHFYCLEYSENGHKMIIDIDFRDSKIILTSDMIRNWETPYEKEMISMDDKIRIMKNIYKYLTIDRGSKRVKIETDGEGYN